MGIESVQNNNGRANTFKDSQALARLSQEKPSFNSLFIAESFKQERSIKHRLAISELYRDVLDKKDKSAAICIVGKDGKEKLHRLAHGGSVEAEALGFIKSFGVESIDDVYLMSTNPLTDKAEKIMLITDKKKIRPMPPVFSDFMREIKFEINVDMPIKYEVADARGLWKYSFDQTSDFIQRMSNGIQDDIDGLEKEFPALKKVRDFSAVIKTDEYKDDPEDFLGEYMEACRALGITLDFEPIEKFT